MQELTQSSNSFSFPYKNKRVTFNPGDIIQISGPNGSGKSSFIESILGVSKNVFHQKVQIAYVPQHLTYTNRTVLAMIEYFAEIKRAPRENVDHVIKAFCLERLLKIKFKHTSAGEQKRILLAIGFLTKPKIILLDEFFQNLDVQMIEDFKTLFNNLKVTYPELIFIIVTHAFELKPEFFTKIITFEKGGEYEIK